MTDLRLSISRGINYIHSEQQADGGFISYSFTNRRKPARPKTYRTTFITSLILDCLNSNGDQKATQICHNAAQFLLGQASDRWSFNYWAQGTKEKESLPYPDDLDDTFCAASALFGHDQSSITPEVLAKLALLLTLTESSVGGPYGTWVVPKDADSKWKDVDLAVNCNVAYFLKLQNISLPNIKQFIDARIATANYTSPYYPTPFPIFFFISRTGLKLKQDLVIRYLLGLRQNGYFGTPLSTALSLITLHNFGYNKSELQSAITYLEKTQQLDGSWPTEAFCFDPTISGVAHVAGSGALTTAFCVQALLLTQTKKNAQMSTFNTAVSKNSASSPARDFHNQVIVGVKKHFEHLGPPSAKKAAHLVDGLIKNDPADQIVLLPEMMRQSLAKNSAISDLNVFKLSQASLYGWIAYTILDDFLDAEGDLHLLPIATDALTQVFHVFSAILPHSSTFSELVSTTFSAMDQANAWEVEHCRIKVQKGRVVIRSLRHKRFDSWDVLAHRASGHALSAYALIFLTNKRASMQTLKPLRQFFHHYLIARQLNDDMHDWEEDVRRGQINAAADYLFQSYSFPHKQTQISLANLIKITRPFFWEITVPQLCQRVGHHLDQARSSLDEATFLQSPDLLLELLHSTKVALVKTGQEQAQALQFIKAYSRN